MLQFVTLKMNDKSIALSLYLDGTLFIKNGAQMSNYDRYIKYNKVIQEFQEQVEISQCIAKGTS